MSSSPAREKTVSFKIFREDVPRFSVTYKDKKDLYESFKKKITELNLKNGTIYWIDDDSDPCLIESADDLFAASKDDPTVKLFARAADDVTSCSDDGDYEPEPLVRGHRHKRVTMKNRRRNRDRTRSRSRSRTRSGSRGHDRAHSRSPSGSLSRSRKHSRGHRHGSPHGGPKHFGRFSRMRSFYDHSPFVAPWGYPVPRGILKGRHGSLRGHRRGPYHRCPWACWGLPPF
ncbi:hypothetical protein Aduo_001077 [Ancylostoma duodenale]